MVVWMPNGVSFPTDINLPRFFLTNIRGGQVGNLDISHYFHSLDVVTWLGKAKPMLHNRDFKKALKAVTATPLVMDLTTAMTAIHTCIGREGALLKCNPISNKD